MAKGSGNKPQQARIAFLERAAHYLTTPLPIPSHISSNSISTPMLTSANHSDTPTINPKSEHISSSSNGLARLYTSHLVSVAQKAQIRLSERKRTICKVCRLPLVLDVTCSDAIENKSKRGKKCANVKVTTCRGCLATKRIPVGAKRQLKKAVRLAAQTEDAATHESVGEKKAGG